MIRFSCLSCGKKLKADEKFVGRKAKCTRCHNVQLVPGGTKANTISVDSDLAKTNNDVGIRFVCGNCGNIKQLASDLIGRRVRCPCCGTIQRLVSSSEYYLGIGDQVDPVFAFDRPLPDEARKKPKNCPWCDEQLTTDSIVCDHCHMFVLEKEGEANSSESSTDGERTSRKSLPRPPTQLPPLLTSNQNQPLQSASNASVWVILGLFLFCCGCPIMNLRNSGSGGNGSLPSGNSSQHYSTSSSGSSGYSLESGIGYDAFRDTERRAGRDPDFQDEAEVRAAIQTLIDNDY